MTQEHETAPGGETRDGHKSAGTDSLKNTRPTALDVNPDGIPADLKAVDRWVMWRWTWNGKKWTKPPFQMNGRKASSTDPATWTTFERAFAAYQAGGWDGIGVALTPDDDLFGIDGDHCIEDGQVARWMLAIIERIDSYTERSPSDTGIRIIGRGKLPPGGRKTGDIEMYDDGRYLTITGRHGKRSTVEHRQAELEAFHADTFPPDAPDKATTSTNVEVPLSDFEVIDLARSARNVAKFGAVYNGDNSRTDDGSPSAGDLSLCSILAFYTQDHGQLDRLFRNSPRMRPKWDEKHGAQTYGAMTIDKALDGLTDTYTPPASGETRSNRPNPATVPPTEQAERLTKALDVFSRWLWLPDTDHVVAAIGAVAANILEGDPVWILFVGPPGSGKTEAIQPLARLPYVHQAATLTEPALLSGVPKRSTEADSTGGLLRQVGDFGIILNKDFSGVLSMHRDQRSAVLAALREIFDGEWSRPVGTGGGRVLHWKGHAGLIGAVTPSVDRHSAVMGALGERFVLYRLVDLTSEQKADRALSNFGDERQMRDELGEAIAAVLEGIGPESPSALTSEERRRLVGVASFAVKARTAVERDGYSRTVVTVPEYEHATRLAKQLAQLRAGILAVGGDEGIAWRIVTKAALDSIPRLRFRILEALRDADNPMRTNDLIEATDIPKKTLAEHVEDLELLRLIEREKVGSASNAPWVHRLGDGVRDSWPSDGGREMSGGERAGPKPGPEPPTSLETQGKESSLKSPNPPWDDISRPPDEGRCSTCGRRLLVRIDGPDPCGYCIEAPPEEVE